MYFRRLTLLVEIGLLLATSCASEDPAAPADDTTLAGKEGVLLGLQQAYDDASQSALSSLFDNAYTFCWDPPSEGMECFGRTTSVFISGRFFESGWYSVGGVTVDRVIVHFAAEGGEAGWTPLTIEREPAQHIFEKVVDYELSVLQGDQIVSVGGGRTTMFIVAQSNGYKILGIFDHTGVWGGLHRAYESAE